DCRLSTSRLPDESQGFSGREAEGDAVDCDKGTALTPGLPGAKPHAEIVDLEYRRVARGVSGRSSGRSHDSPVSSRSQHSAECAPPTSISGGGFSAHFRSDSGHRPTKAHPRMPSPRWGCPTIVGKTRIRGPVSRGADAISPRV